MGEARDKALAAQAASKGMALATEETRNGALSAMAQALRDHVAQIVEANGVDMQRAREKGTSESLLDRLMLDEGRVREMADALDDLVGLPDPVGQVQV